MNLSYKGIKEAYPKLRAKVGKKVTAYIELSRPFTLLGALLAGIFLTVLFSKVNNTPISIWKVLFVGLILMFLQGGGQCFNQAIAEEVEIDRINGKVYRPVIRGDLSLREAKVFGLSVTIVGCTLAFLVNVKFGIFASLIGFFAISYTAPPLRVKRFFVLNNLHQGVARGFLPAMYVASLYESYGLLPVLFGIPLMVWVSTFQTAKDWNDVKGDAEFNIQTLPVVLGKSQTLKAMVFGGCLSFFILTLFVWLKLFPLSFIALFALAIPSACIIISLKRGYVLEKMENNVGWVLFYLTLGLWYVLPALLV